MSKTSLDIVIQEASWDDTDIRREMFSIRMAVFVDEQHVPPEEELDGRDPVCRHVIARDSCGSAIGTARMQRDGHIGRIAVVKAWRGRRVGARLVGALLEFAEDDGLGVVNLDSQVQALGFYETLGFVAHGDVFLDAGIPHKNMVLRLANRRSTSLHARETA